jgi:hypothetical protein
MRGNAEPSLPAERKKTAPAEEYVPGDFVAGNRGADFASSDCTNIVLNKGTYEIRR